MRWVYPHPLCRNSFEIAFTNVFAFSGRGLGAQVNTGDGRSWDSERVCFIDYPAKFMFILFNLLSLPSDSYAHRRTPAQTCRTGPVFVLDILGMSPERGGFSGRMHSGFWYRGRSEGSIWRDQPWLGGKLRGGKGPKSANQAQNSIEIAHSLAD